MGWRCCPDADIALNYYHIPLSRCPKSFCSLVKFLNGAYCRCDKLGVVKPEVPVLWVNNGYRFRENALHILGGEAELGAAVAYNVERERIERGELLQVISKRSDVFLEPLVGNVRDSTRILDVSRDIQRDRWIGHLETYITGAISNTK